ncbi:glycosyltransferase [Dyella sp. ASV21]|uniref:glycosyltransferase family 2 protein n=1 Tax=Dyella sp. ASV21 TaxID=2795114 RepID=UPI0018EDD6F7|nr:glycosyltransferase [Dyella sp. ASV21]
MTPLVSFILPCYNASQWLEQALDSLFRQTYANVEVIAVDDGSTDDTAYLLETYRQKEHRLFVERNQRNEGIVVSLNRGLDLANGAYIGRMDADDISHPERTARQLAYLTERKIDFCGSWFREVGQGISRTCRWPSSEAALRAAMIFQNTICHPTLMARREVFERFQYRQSHRLAEDYDLYVRASTHFRMANVPEVLLDYRRHPQQSTQAQRAAMERVTEGIRENSLKQQGFLPTKDELRVHNLIRAPQSIHSIEDLQAIEAWLNKILAAYSDDEARKVVASQWIRACVRAAPLGRAMWQALRRSPLAKISGINSLTQLDLKVLSVLKLDYHSSPFQALRRLGLSA